MTFEFFSPHITIESKFSNSGFCGGYDCSRCDGICYTQVKTTNGNWIYIGRDGDWAIHSSI